jgi:hypothetical protein
MEVLDRDGQPGLSRKEIDAASSAVVVFDDHDASGDGLLDEGEMRALLAAVSPLGKPRPFARDPRDHLPLQGMLAFQETGGEPCEQFESFVEDALFHIDLVGGEQVGLKDQLKKVLETGECSIRGTESAQLLADLADHWRKSRLMDIFREMGVN